MALARLQLLKSPAYLNIQREVDGVETVDTDFDEPLITLLEVATAFAESYTARTLERTASTPDIVEYRTGRNERNLYIDEFPVSEIVLVEIWDGDSWETVDSDHYELRKERTLVYPIRTQAQNASYNSWPRIDEGIRITYKGGYLTTDWMTLEPVASFPVPADLENAICELAMKDWFDTQASTKGRFMMSSISRGSESAGYDTFVKGMPEAARLALDKYTDPHV